MKELQSINEWKDILEQSKSAPLLVLKHSTTCPISAAAFNRFHAYETEMPKYFLKVRESRPVSNAIESDLGVVHQSPQAFILNEGKAVWNASHGAVNQTEIDKGIKENV
ncbi:bacillithiol system redox-active protein YtxJ [Sporosarcina sp. G11-34]|uniref:bacillithiol system redox-active protein YtxJ n=1 Tax=Sporosarcina sp. G11-34 TaxID=2849605 RepID=UPI0022A9A874|nr:bacillithiol system redox-active protein YtxJ [Sporosarcina sp. G11-34]